MNESLFAFRYFLEGIASEYNSVEFPALNIAKSLKEVKEL